MKDRKKEAAPFFVERKFLDKITAEELVNRILRSHAGGAAAGRAARP